MDNTIYIIIHGFAGDISEIKYLNDFLIKKELKVHSILLKGHGTNKSDMKKYNYKQWIDHAICEILHIKKDYKNICLIGFSMGGLICVNIMQHIKISKLILINTPVYFWDIKLILKNVLFDIKNKKRDNINFYLHSSSKAPFKSLINFLIILNKTKKIFSNVNVNTLILQCLDDDTVKNKSAVYIYNLIKTQAEIKYYKTGGHQVLLSSTKDLVCEDIFNFILK